MIKSAGPPRFSDTKYIVCFHILIMSLRTTSFLVLSAFQLVVSSSPLFDRQSKEFQVSLPVERFASVARTNAVQEFNKFLENLTDTNNFLNMTWNFDKTKIDVVRTCMHETQDNVVRGKGPARVFPFTPNSKAYISQLYGRVTYETQISCLCFRFPCGKHDTGRKVQPHGPTNRRIGTSAAGDCSCRPSPDKV